MLWTVARAAEFLGMKPYQVYYLLTIGEIEAVKIGKVWRVSPDGVKAYGERKAA